MSGLYLALAIHDDSESVPTTLQNMKIIAPHDDFYMIGPRNTVTQAAKHLTDRLRKKLLHIDASKTRKLSESGGILVSGSPEGLDSFESAASCDVSKATADLCQRMKATADLCQRISNLDDPQNCIHAPKALRSPIRPRALLSFRVRDIIHQLYFFFFFFFLLI